MNIETLNSFKNKTILEYYMKSIIGLTNNSVGTAGGIITQSYGKSSHMYKRSIMRSIVDHNYQN
jgi:hypothetical protein